MSIFKAYIDRERSILLVFKGLYVFFLLLLESTDLDTLRLLIDEALPFSIILLLLSLLLLLMLLSLELDLLLSLSDESSFLFLFFAFASNFTFLVFDFESTGYTLFSDFVPCFFYAGFPC